MISEIYILFFKANLTIRHTATVSQKKSGTSKKIQWDFQISRVGSLDFLDLKVNGSPVRLKCIVLWVGMLTGCPLCRESHPLCRLKNPMIISISLLVGFHPATQRVQSTPGNNTRKRGSDSK